MKKQLLMFAALVLGGAMVASAHPTNEEYATRGECEAVFADSSKFDRERLVMLGIFPTNGAAQRTFRDLFECQYDRDENVWHIVYIGG